ncbi:MAG: APC family permease [bacterium]|nr:APC family permease [bacterium]
MLKKIKNLIIGRAKNLEDPHVFHQISLIAFLAWIGLGVDGLSSSCYGPEEAYRALGMYSHLGIYLALATAATVFIISASYSQIIELFPTGGGGYLVASKLLGQYAGLVSGCALVVDYVLTIAISVSSGMDAVLSFMPPFFLEHKLVTAFLVIGFLTILNLRGVKESVLVLAPVFLTFVITHTLVILVGIFGHTSALPAMVAETVRETQYGIQNLGFFAVLVILMRAYSLGGGTYTGIEAVSNGLQILREPKVKTAKRTMLYMAVSLAFTAGGIIVCYLLNNIHPQPGKTMNAVLISTVAGQWIVQGIPIGYGFIILTLLSEALLLFIAAQTGFLAGPRVLANMAQDGWIPRRFAHLSDRLVTRNGIILMGLAALLTVWYTKGNVSVLVVLYSINVFLTFTLSQLGMCVHWWKKRRTESKWIKRLLINGIGLVITTGILCATVILKFEVGGWVTLVITVSFILFCLWIKSHYTAVRKVFKRLDAILTDLPLPEHPPKLPPKDPKAPTAILMVNQFNGLGIHSMLAIIKSFRKQFTQFVFVSVGEVDTSKFKGVEELDRLREATESALKKYVEIANKLGFYAEYRYSIGTDAIDELEILCREATKEFPNSVCFAGQLIFPKENWATRQLHNQAAFAIQRQLLFHGINMVILPIRAIG